MAGLINTGQGGADVDRGHRQRLKALWAANMAAARTRRGWSQAELGRRAGVDQSSIARNERAQTLPSEEHKLRIARALGRNPDRLFPLRLPPEA